MIETGAGYHTFPAVRGEQAGRPCFIAMCPLGVVPELFLFDEADLPAPLRAQRTLNRTRVPAIARYLVAHPSSYVLSALTASVDSKVKFNPFSMDLSNSLGVLHIPHGAKILINDGQHRRAAIEQAIRQAPDMAKDNVPVLFFSDEGLKRSQQVFSDLNRFAIRPSNSLSTLYDHREPGAEMARFLSSECRAFRGLTEMEKSTISNRSATLFTLSSIKLSSRVLLRKGPRDEISDAERMIAKEFWDCVNLSIPDWSKAARKEVSSGTLRQQFIHAHGIALHALALLGSALLEVNARSWKNQLRRLDSVDWRRANSVWEGRALVNGRISKAATQVRLTANYLKAAVGVPLNEHERALEAEYKKVLKLERGGKR